MLRNLLLLCIALLSLPLFAQQNRTIDGTNNNLSNPDWGATGAELSTITTVAYEDGVNTPAAPDRTNPRIISNELFAQNGLFNDPLALSDFVWVFGQFLDHDISLVTNSPVETADIHVNFADVHFNPNNMHDQVYIRMNRSMPRPGTGTSASNPRQFSNGITHWIDGSNVYGSTDELANYLRTFSGGKLKTSAGNLLPYNTVNNEADGANDPNAPHMENENPFNTLLFVAGDVRVNEQPLLIGFHTLFVREHNRICDELAIEHPDWLDEELYQYARKKVSGYLQSIVYNEWLPAIGVHLPEYTGYDSSVYPNISNVFAAAAFRMGHTLLNSNLQLINDDGTDHASVTLAEAFFNPQMLADEGMDRFFKGMATQIQQDLDSKVVDDVRNFLFGPPVLGMGGLDLPAININRGRERGLPDFNTIRTDLGLPKYNSFVELCSNQAVVTALSGLYDSIDDVDAWVGMLCEDHMSDALFGETIMKIMEQQFGVLRDGDRFYYENDPVLTAAEKTEIAATTFRDIIMRNTNITLMQSNVFKAMPHDSICSATTSTLAMTGNIETFTGIELADASIALTNIDAELLATANSNVNGNYLFFDEQATCETYYITPSLEGDIRKGVDVWDLVLMLRHVLGIEHFDSPYQHMAADVNDNGMVTATDVTDMQRVLLYFDNELPNNQRDWQFVPSTFNFVDVNNPFVENIPDYAWVDLSEYNADQTFVAVKTGDVSGNADPANLNGAGDTRSGETLTFEIANQRLEAEQTVTVDFTIPEMTSMAAYQYVLNFENTALELVGIQPIELDNLKPDNFVVKAENGTIATNWYHPTGVTKADKTVAFTLTFEAKTNGELKDLLSLNNDLATAKAFQTDSNEGKVELVFNTPTATDDFVLYQNRPNPFTEQTSIGFTLPEAMPAHISFYDVTGRMLHQIDQDFANGYNEITVHQSDLGANGVIYYELTTERGSVVRKMVRQR